MNGFLELKKIMDEVKKDFEALGISANIKIIENKPQSFSFRIGAEGPLFTKEVERCYIRVDISRREKILKNVEAKEIRPIYPDILPFIVVVMDLEEILAEKLRAIVKHVKPRDLYDLWFLIKMGMKIDLSLINKKLEYYKIKFNIKKFVENIESLERVWERELEPVIIGNLQNFDIIKKDVLEKFYAVDGVKSV